MDDEDLDEDWDPNWTPFTFVPWAVRREVQTMQFRELEAEVDVPMGSSWYPCPNGTIDLEGESHDDKAGQAGPSGKDPRSDQSWTADP